MIDPGILFDFGFASLNVEETGGIALPDAIGRALTDFEISDPLAVRRYLQQNAEVVDVLCEARTHIDRVFGSDTPVLLETELDTATTTAKLFAFIAVTSPVEDALSQLREFRSSWWNKKRSEIPQFLYFDVTRQPV